jgi:alkanesulfonate monooxygenase SsuD/methylene tetrahydromethanopterin reductase-like flavin-dependent oxidoreductase (luciferase family)
MPEPIALLAFWKNYDRKTYLRAAQLADELGYHSFWLPEAWGYEVFTLLTEMAVHTRRIQLGTGIINVFSRSPGLIAMSAATVDEISEGRLILGVGASGKNVIEGFHGRPFDKPLSQVRDVIKVTRTLLAGQKESEAGATLAQYRPFKLEMKPLRPGIPIYVAALKQKAIEQIGECADGWIPTFWPYDKLAEGRAWIAAGAARAGRDASKIVTAPFTTALPLGGAGGSTMARQIISFYIGGMGDYYIELLTRFGFGEDCKTIAGLYQDKATRAQAASAVTDAMIEALTITGDPAHCLEELRRRRSFGMDLPILNLPTNVPWEMVEAFIRGMAPRS